MKTVEEERQRKRLPRKRAVRRNRTVFRDERSRGKGGAIGADRPSSQNARFGQRSFIRMQLRSRLLLGSTCDHVATGTRRSPASSICFLRRRVRRRGSFSGLSGRGSRGPTVATRGEISSWLFLGPRASGEAVFARFGGPSFPQSLKMTSYRSRREQRLPEYNSR